MGSCCEGSMALPHKTAWRINPIQQSHFCSHHPKDIKVEDWMWWHLRSGGRRIKGIFATQRIWDHPTSKTQSQTKRAEVERQSAPVLVTCYSGGGVCRQTTEAECTHAGYLLQPRGGVHRQTNGVWIRLKKKGNCLLPDHGWPDDNTTSSTLGAKGQTIHQGAQLHTDKREEEQWLEAWGTTVCWKLFFRRMWWKLGNNMNILIVTGYKFK